MRQCESPGLNPEAAKEQAKRREFWEEPTSLRKGLGGGASGEGAAPRVFSLWERSGRKGRGAA